jgi:hypothetical protein
MSPGFLLTYFCAIGNALGRMHAAEPPSAFRQARAGFGVLTLSSKDQLTAAAQKPP